jgi:LL-diaminopimelate aminotransferase
MIKPNSVIQNLKSFAFDDIEEKYQNLIKHNIKPIDFGIGDPKEETPNFIRQIAKKSIDINASKGYPLYDGTIEYREAISNWNKKRFNISLDPTTEVCSAIGAKEIVFNIPNAFIEPGDYVLIPNPGYPPYLKGTLFARGIPYFLNLTEENNFLPNLEEVPTKILKKAKILWLNYPNSPTGKIAPLKYLKKVISIAKKYEILIISDECYSEIYYNKKPNSILEVSKENALSINSLSKRSCMTGWRVAWIAGEKKLIKSVKKLKTNIDSGIPYFIQDAAIAALKDEEHVKKQRETYKTKKEILIKAFVEMGLEKSTPEGTFYIWQKLSKEIKGKDLAKKLLEKNYGIVVTPGELLSEKIENNINPGENYIRLALIPSIEECKLAAKKIKKAISTL